jgi:uncharacterized membrane protein HdeD (DUF308 family)
LTIQQKTGTQAKRHPLRPHRFTREWLKWILLFLGGLILLFIATQYGIDTAFNSYIDNTNIFQVMNGAQNVPEPSSLLLLASGVIGIIGLRRRQGR